MRVRRPMGVALVATLFLAGASGAAALGLQLVGDSSDAGSSDTPSGESGAPDQETSPVTGVLTTEAPQAEADDVHVAVGEEASVGGLALSVQGATIDRDIGGYPHVVVTVLIRNDSKRSQRVGPLVWWLEDATGTRLQSGPNDRSDALQNGRLRNGEEVTGTLDFASPNGSYLVVYAPPSRGERTRLVWEVTV